MANHKFLDWNGSTNVHLSEWGDGVTYFHIMNFCNIGGKEKIQKASRMGLGEGSRWHRMVSDFSEHSGNRSQWSTVFKNWGRRMISANGWIRCPWLYPLIDHDLASIHRKSAFMEAVASSTTCQGTQEESWPPVHLVIGKQTLVLVMDPEVAHEMALGPLDHGSGTLENIDLGNHPRARKPLWESRSSVEETLQHAVGAKKSKIGQLEKSKEQLYFIHIAPFPRWHSSMSRQPFSACDFILTKVRVNELLSAQIP